MVSLCHNKVIVHSTLARRAGGLLLSVVATTAFAAGAVLAYTGEEVNNIARDITVLIQGINPGSGVIIAREGDAYYVLTAKHVVGTEDQYQIITADKKSHALDYKTVKKLPGVDLAVLTFRSRDDYRPARLANSNNVKEGATVFVSGWPNPGQAITKRIRQFTTGQLSARPDQPLADGYALVYTNVTRVGMSGGPVLDTGGRVIGIHGRAESETVDPGLQESGASQPPAKVGFNLGIPVNTFLDLAPQSGVDLGLRAENSPATDLSQPYVAPDKPQQEDTIDNINKVISTFSRSLDVIQGIRSLFR